VGLGDEGSAGGGGSRALLPPPSEEQDVSVGADVHIIDAIAIFHFVEAVAVRVRDSGSAVRQEAAHLVHRLRGIMPQVVDDRTIIQLEYHGPSLSPYGRF
jgi:hypothetical protein